MLGVNKTLQPKIQRCFAFERGRCHRGDSCKFIHSISENSTATIDHVSINGKTAVSSGESVVIDPVVGISRSQASSEKVCRHFRQKGRCNFGESCAFLHPVELHHVASVEFDSKLESVDHWGASKSEADLRFKSNRVSHSIKEKKVCKFYKAGFCRYGQKCHNRHLKTRHVEEQPEDTSHNQNSLDVCNSTKQVKCTAQLLGADVDQGKQDEGVVVSGVKASPGNMMGELLPEKPCAALEQDLKKMRETEILQLCRRFPKAQQRSDNGNTVLTFVFEPTDPDWPYDVKQMNIEVSFPHGYPSQMMIVKVIGSERLPALVERSLSESIQSWVTKRYNKTRSTGSWELVFRPMLQWIDKNAENLMTEALKEYKRDLMAKSAGLEFIPATKLRQIYPEAVNSTSWTEDQLMNTDEGIANSERKLQNAESEPMATVNEEDDKENVSLLHLSSPPSSRKGTEVTLCGLQLTDGAATLRLSQATLIVACTRCTNTNEARLVPGHAYAAACAYCHISQLMEFSATIAHQVSSVVGWLSLDGCRAFDLVVADCQFLIGCISCAKEEKLVSLSPGQHNTTWCRHCHQKLTLIFDNVRFLQLSASVQIDASKAVQLDVKKRVKNVRDPAIQEGQPLPNNGTCRHFKKSYRWLRFPCCGKAYPCDMCHNEVETDHDMKLANRMICGFCAKEQAYASEKPCTACSNLLTNKTTAFWEGGRGCRDQVKMCRNDPKKYANLMKTASLSCSERKSETNKKTTKLKS